MVQITLHYTLPTSYAKVLTNDAHVPKTNHLKYMYVICAIYVLLLYVLDDVCKYLNKNLHYTRYSHLQRAIIRREKSKSPFFVQFRFINRGTGSALMAKAE